jgi:hypothetical protein
MDPTGQRMPGRRNHQPAITMPVTRDVIKFEVETVLCAIAHTTRLAFTEDTKLDSNPFWFTGQMKAALCVPFSKIARSHGGSTMAPSDTGSCKTVKDCIELTSAKANTAGPAGAKLVNEFVLPH